jgi:hypothetical protein
MALITVPFTFTVGAVIVASQHNSCFSVIYSDYNGNITTANLSASAGIVDTQLAQISTASKVSGAALIPLGSVPTGAGALPAKNGGSGADLSTSVQGSIPYFSATGVESALAPGTSGQVVASQGAAANPQFVTLIPSILDYGTSASASTAKTIATLLVAYGRITISGSSSQAITNLPFTSSATYQGSVTPYDASGAYNEGPSFIANSGAQVTIYNNHNDSRVFSWIMWGT